MSFPVTSVAGGDGSWDKLLSHLRGLDRCQLEEFKLGLQSLRRLPGCSQKIPWADVKAADPADLLCLLKEHFPGRQGWGVTLRIFENMNLISLCEDLRAEVNARAGTYRDRMKAKLLAMWDRVPWPEDHIYLRSVTEQEHEELRRLLYPERTGARPKTVVLHGAAGVGKTTLATKVLMHWAEGLLFQHNFSYVSYVSCQQLREVGDTTFASLLSRDSPDSPAAVEYFMSHSERLLFVIDGFEEMTMLSDLDGSLPCPDWDQQLPVARILLHLLKKELAPSATLLITTRDCRSEELKQLLLNPWFIRIPGFTEGDQEEYFFRYFGDQNKARNILQWIRKHEALSCSCCAPLVCWTVCSSLKRQMARCPSFQLDAQTPARLYACFFSSVFETVEVSWSKQSWLEQWRALCSLAAAGMWSSNFTFAKEDIEHRHLQAPLIDCLFRLNILRKASDCEDCVTFTHQSFQVFWGALFYVLRGTEGAIGGLSKHQEMKVLLNDAFVDTNSYWHQMVLFFFGLLNRDLAREVEDTLHFKMCPTVVDELLKWAEELSTSDVISCSFECLLFFQCLYEMQEEAVVKQMLSHVLEADLDLGDLQFQAISYCLKHCQRLRKLRLSVSCHIPRTESTVKRETLVNSKLQQWRDVCSVFHSGNLSELDLSNSKLSALSMKTLCYELRNPRCKLQKLTCKSITPVTVLKELVLVLHGNSRLTHLNLSSNRLGVTVSTMIFKTLRHSACNLKYLCLEKCDLSAASSEALASVLTSTQRTARLSLGFNPLQDDGVRWLCASLRQPDCALERLALCCCQLGVPSCRHLSDALRQNRSLTHLNLRKNQLGDEGVRFLCEALRRPDCLLQSLDLSECSFRAEGCRALAAVLERNRRLKVLDIGRNRVQDAGGRRLCQALTRSGCALSTLGMEKCSLTSACCRHLSSVLGGSKSLVTLNLLGNALGPAGVNTLWKSLKKPTCKLQTLG
ncbi:NACHT, LRR and PYD domains-containing protein 13 [Pteronotus mesoamericanus]|uniref:NACHT, LRR and PYD domains-containing protein 13 n=1 Tax=Pteronotus mesoamericanus TaxID=1884717 RepID=UPI0023EB9A9D|nr:NACHT, LRR and PYD domains-containing protein 13 [Pteronotus parnellii mesoamericanus]